MRSEELKQNVTVYGPLFPEPVQIIIAVPMGNSVKLIGKGVRSSTVYEPILSAEQLAQLHASPAQEEIRWIKIVTLCRIQAHKTKPAHPKFMSYWQHSCVRQLTMLRQLRSGLVRDGGALFKFVSLSTEAFSVIS